MRRLLGLCVVVLLSLAVNAPAQITPTLLAGMKWRQIGPFRGGRVLAVAGVPGDPNTYYFGAVAGGIFKSTNGGMTWIPTFDRQNIASIGAIAVIPALLIGVLGSSHPPAPRDSGLVACTYPLSTQDVPAADYRKIRAQFAGSRWADLRNAGTAYVDLATQLLHARGTDGYETV